MKRKIIDLEKRGKIIGILLKILDYLALPLMFLFGFFVSNVLLAGKSNDSALKLALDSSCGFVSALIIFSSIILVLSCYYLDSRLNLFLKKMEVFYNEGENDR